MGKRKDNTIINGIKSKYKDIEFKLIIEKCSFMGLYIEMRLKDTNLKTKVIIHPNLSWKEIHFKVEEKRLMLLNENVYYVDECDICKNSIGRFASCLNCNKKYCSNCYIYLMKITEGLLNCNFCNHSFGITISPHVVNECLKNNFDLE
jgi:hypothetical protein